MQGIEDIKERIECKIYIQGYIIYMYIHKEL